MTKHVDSTHSDVPVATAVLRENALMEPAHVSPIATAKNAVQMVAEVHVAAVLTVTLALTECVNR